MEGDGEKGKKMRKFATISNKTTLQMSKRIILMATALVSALAMMAQMRGYDTNFRYSPHNFVDTIPIEFERDQIYVTVTMNGQKRRFNLDTGSSQGATYRGARIGSWTELGNVVSRDGAGNLDTVRVVQLPPFRLGTLTVSDYVVSMFDRKPIRKDYDVILGFDLFNKGLCCKIDTRQKIMIITDRRDFFDGEPGYGIRYKLKWFVPYLLLSPFKRHVDEVLFDTGARQLYSMNKKSFDTHAYKSKNVNSQVEGTAEGSFAIGHSGKEAPDKIVFLKLNRLKWDEFAFTHVRAMTTQGASRVGAQILQYGTITINGFRRKITFQPFDTTADSVEVNNKAYSIAFVPHNGQASIGLVLKNSSEYKAGLRQGDIILVIDGKAVPTFEDFLRYPFIEGRTHRMLVKTKEGQNKEVRYTRAQGDR